MKSEGFDLIQSIQRYFKIQPWQEIIQWASKNINFSNDISAQRNFLDFSLYPYQKDILKEWEDTEHIKTVTVCAPEQCGKTCMFVVGMLWRMIFAPSQQIIAYPNDQLASETNQTKILPLMKFIPQLKLELEKPRSFRSDRYAFSNCISYFQGAGSKIVSKSCQVAIGDEVDAFPQIGKVDNVAELKKRTRSYKSSILFLVCTPTEQNGKIWRSFLKSSQGYWHLRCQHCGQLTIRSCDIFNLQFESTYSQELKEHIVIPQTIRLVCPKCGFQHTEDMKRSMNVDGGYIHKLPQRLKEAPGFQIGALASQLPALSWKAIATAQLEAGKKADIQSQTTFDNSFRGLPYKRRQIIKEEFDRLTYHCWKQIEAPKGENIEAVFIVADTQDDRSVVGVFAMDVNDNLYLLETKELQYLTISEEDREVINRDRSEPIQTVQDLLSKEWMGIKPMVVTIDRLGHRTNDVNYFANKHPNVIMYNGTRLQSEMYRRSDKNPRVVFVSARQYQSSLIYYLYEQKNRSNNYLYFYPQISNEVLKQIYCVKPDNTKKFGNSPQNWEPDHGAVHDYFDVIKMAYFTRDYCVATLSYKRWRIGQSPMIRKRWEKYLKKMNEVKSNEDHSSISG